MPEMTWDYIAGYVDGDGSIGFSRRARGKNERTDRPAAYMPFLTIHGCHEGILLAIAEFIGAGFVRPHQRRGKPKRWRDAFYYRLGGSKNLRSVLRELAPRLIIKARQAEEVLAFLLRRKEEKNRPWKDVDYAAVDTLRQLNLRGAQVL